jgi:hypothetical protein
MKSLLFFLLFFSFVFSNAFGQSDKPPVQETLDAITQRGRQLQAYDVAAWHATDAVMALKPENGSFTTYVARRNGTNWTVVFGKLNDTKDKFIVAYEAVQDGTPESFKATKLDKVREESGFYADAAKALQTAKTDFGKVTRPYNAAVLPADEADFFVYLLPAQTEAGKFPLGGDVRYKISENGEKILEKRQMHRSIIEFQAPPPNVKAETGIHTAILDDIPEDSDVFHVLTRNLNLPELIVTNKFIYQVAADGSIKYLMTREAFMKIGKP